MDNRESNETLCQFRREALRDLLRQLEACACGYDHPVMPFITNRQEQYSAKKTSQLINSLTACCPQFLCDFYKSILYCAIRSFSTPCTIRSGGLTMGIYNPAFTFGDLISYLHSEELEASECRESSISFGILKRPVSGLLSASMTALYVFLSGRPEPDPNLLEGEFIPMQTGEAEDEPFCPDGEEAAAEFYGEYSGEPPCQLETPFPEPEEYCRHYENILRLYPEQYNPLQFDRHMEEMVNHFLARQELTSFSDRDTHLVTITYLKKALKLLQNIQS